MREGAVRFIIRDTIMKPLVYILGLFGVNVVVSFAAGLAFALFLFRGDPVFAAVPAILAAPAILLQPWFLAFLFFSNGLFMAAFLTTAVTALVYWSLNRLEMLEGLKTALSRFNSRKAFALIGAVVLLAISVSIARQIDFPPLRQGLPPSVKASWVNVTDSRYYCLGSFIDSEWLWQARVSEPELARLADRFNLRPIDGDQVPDAFRKMPPYWWTPSITDGTRAFSTPGFPAGERGPDGWHAVATWNPDDQVLYVWIKDNF